MSENNAIEMDQVAIIGMSGRFPGARDIDQLWHNLVEGVESITFFSDEELEEAGIDMTKLQDDNYIKARPFLEDIEFFDADFFGYNPREAMMMDPQHRLFLENSWGAFENAGYDPQTYTGRIGLYAGCDTNTYLLYNIILNNPSLIESDTLQVKMNDKDYLCTRVSYKLNLKGPSMMVQSACSTSLVAVHLACESLLSGECDMALAGAVSITLPQKTGYLYQQGGVVSPDGHCRAFDEKARGTVYGDGVGAVLLKRLEDAMDDGDNIYAIIRGSAINNDGADRVGYTAPGVSGQAKVIQEALSISGVKADTIGYIETHGTGTELGDSVEIEALTQAFGMNGKKKQFCPIGSIKTNIGHTSTASGIASLIKTALCLKNSVIPPTLNYEKPNPKIDFENSPFYVNTNVKKWESGLEPRRAGVSAFGLGGTNAHVVLEEAPSIHPSSRKKGDSHILTISARTEVALETATDNMLAYLKENPEVDISDVAFTLQLGRKDFCYRKTLLVTSVDDAIASLEQKNIKPYEIGYVDNDRPSVIFMFPGLGNQYENMARELYLNQPVFKCHLDKCAQIVKNQIGLDIREIMFKEKQSKTDAVDNKRFDMKKLFELDNHVAPEMKQPSIAYPIIFSVEYALAQLFLELGITPKAMIGHSIGEYTAACIAGVFSIEDGLYLICQRGQLIEELPEGAMLSVMLSEDKVKSFINEDLSLSTVDSPTTCVIGGKSEAVSILEKKLLSEGIACRPVATTHAFHTQMMEPAIEKYRKIVEDIKLSTPQIPFISNVTGAYIRDEQAIDSEYWVKHMRSTVRFSEGIAKLWKDTNRLFVEIGPGNTLGTYVKQHPHGKDPLKRIISTLSTYFDKQSDMHFILAALGRMWVYGVDIKWEVLYEEGHVFRIPIPTYPFERKRFFLGSTQMNTSLSIQHQVQDINTNNQSLDNVEMLHERPNLRGEFIQPKTETEIQIADIWKQVLCIEDIGIKDDFFELGGNSLLAVKAIFEIQRVFGESIPMSVLIKQPTIEFLGNYIDTVQWVGSGGDKTSEGSDIQSESSIDWEVIEI